MNHFIDLIAQCIPGEFIAQGEVEKFIKRRTIDKDDFLLEPGKICRRVIFVTKGSCYMYREKRGRQEVTEFYFEGMLNADYVSFIRQLPSDQYIRALEDMEVEVISHENLHWLYDHLPVVNRVGRMLTENLICGIRKRTLSYQNDTPELRYLKLLKERPMLFQQVPQYLIATYLGITPVGLSKIRYRLKTGG